MVSSVIGIRIDKKTSEIVVKLNQLKIVKSRTVAVKFIMKHGIIQTRKIIERKEESHEIIRKWKKEGFPLLPDDLSERSIEERE